MQTLRNILQHVINVFTELVLNPEQSFIKLRNTCKRRPGSSSMIWTPPPSPAPGRWRQQARLFALGNWHKACGITPHTACDDAALAAVWGGVWCVSAVSPVVAVDGGDFQALWVSSPSSPALAWTSAGVLLQTQSQTHTLPQALKSREYWLCTHTRFTKHVCLLQARHWSVTSRCFINAYIAKDCPDNRLQCIHPYVQCTTHKFNADTDFTHCNAKIHVKSGSVILVLFV